MRVRGRLGWAGPAGARMSPLAPAVRCALLVLLAGAALAGCVGTPPTEGPTGTVTVLAPASLAGVLPAVVYRFETSHSAVHLRVDYGPDTGHAATPAGDLLIVEGPQALATTGPTATAVARNQFVLAVAPTDPAGLASVRDLARPGLRVAMCAPVQPCGALAASILAGASVVATAPSLVDDTRAALALVQQGRADVAMVYRTDVRAAGEAVAAIEFPESSGALATYEAVVRPNASNAGAARAFLSFLGTTEVQTVLTDHAFQLP